jgi:hypothetical protein
MLVPVQRTWVVAEVVTAAYLNANVRDATNFLLTPPLCDVFQNVAQSIPNATLTALTFDSENYDNDGAHSTVTNTSRITFQTAGWHQYDAVYNSAASTAGYRLASAYKNGVLYKLGSRYAAPSTAQGTASASGSVQVVAGDYLEIYVYQTTGGSLSTDLSFGRSWCTTRWVST